MTSEYPNRLHGFLWALGLVLAMLPALPAQAQAQELNFQLVEQKTIGFYTQKQWDSLENTARRAIEAGIDYKDLRYRLGICYYEQKKYSKAIPQFEKTLTFDSSDDILKEYLYYSYLFAGLWREAEAVEAGFSDDYKKTKGIKTSKLLESIEIEGGFKFSSQDAKTIKANKVGDISFLGGGLTHKLGARSRLAHGVNFLGQSMYWGSYKQAQYHIETGHYLGKGFYITPAFTFLTMSAEISTTFNPPIPVPGRFGFVQRYYKADQLQNGMVFYLAAGKRVGSLSVEPYVSYSMFSTVSDTTVGGDKLSPPRGSWQTKGTFTESMPLVQSGVKLGFMPLALNGKLYASAAFSTQMNVNVGTNSLIVYATAGFRPSAKLLLEGSYYQGTARFVNEFNASVVSNTPDLTNSRIGVTFSYNLSPKITVYGIYQNESRTEALADFDYTFNSVISGLKFNL